MVVPSARPKAKSVAANAGTLKGMRGWTRRAVLMSIFTVLQPNEIWSDVIAQSDRVKHSFRVNL